MADRAIVLKQLKDGSGRLCIHYFVRADNGAIQTAIDPGNKIPWLRGGTKGYIACNPQQNAVLKQDGMETFVCLRTDDIRAATCPACLETKEAVEMLGHYAELETANNDPQALIEYQRAVEEALSA